MARKWNTDEDIAPMEKKVSVVGIVGVLISKDSANINKQTYKKLNICDSCDKIKPQRQIRL